MPTNTPHDPRGPPRRASTRPRPQNSCAVIDNIVECHEKGQPVLVGTVSIEKSRRRSPSCSRRRGVKHNVLNAKYHEKEAEIVAQAGKRGAVTIATNMAGRGTDIILGGNAELCPRDALRKRGMQSEELIAAVHRLRRDRQRGDPGLRASTFSQLDAVLQGADRARGAGRCVEAGGLFIIGTERHESRRIDNQLRGRSGRQGDPGESRVSTSSLEDDLMRLFGGERIAKLDGTRSAWTRTRPSRQRCSPAPSRSAQRTVEGRNFDIRKHVLAVRRRHEPSSAKSSTASAQQVLDGEDLRERVLHMIDEVVEEKVTRYCAGRPARALGHPLARAGLCAD